MSVLVSHSHPTYRPAEQTLESMPCRHGLLERLTLALPVRNEVVQPERLYLFLPMRVGIDRGELGNGALDLLALVQPAVLLPVR